MPTLAGMEMSRVMRMEMEVMWSTERWSLEATAPESTGSRLVEMGTTKEPGRSKNFLAWPSTPFMASEASRVKPAAFCRRSMRMAESTKSKRLKKQEPRVMGTAKRMRFTSSSFRGAAAMPSPARSFLSRRFCRSL